MLQTGVVNASAHLMRALEHLVTYILCLGGSTLWVMTQLTSQMIAIIITLSCCQLTQRTHSWFVAVWRTQILPLYQINHAYTSKTYVIPVCPRSVALHLPRFISQTCPKNSQDKMLLFERTRRLLSSLQESNCPFSVY